MDRSGQELLALVVATAAPHHPDGDAGAAADLAIVLGTAPLAILTGSRPVADAPAARYELRRRGVCAEDSPAAARLLAALWRAREAEEAREPRGACGLPIDRRPRATPPGYRRLGEAPCVGHGGTIEGCGGQTGIATLAQWGGRLLWVREAIAGDHFLVSSNARWGMKHGAALPWYLRQVLHLAVEPAPAWDEVAALVELLDPLHRSVLRHPRWTPRTARRMLGPSL